MLRPNHHLTAAGKLYPQAWQQCDEFRADRGNGLPKWPAWCYLPMAGWYAIASEGAPFLPPQRAGDVGRLSALGTWRVSQGIYRFDEELRTALADTTLKGEIPTEVLLRLPEWCLYIETPGMSWQGSELYGFFVHLEWDANTERKELRLLLDTEASLTPLPVHIGPWTVTEAIDRMHSEAGKHAPKAGIDLPTGAAAMDTIQQLAVEVQPLLAMVLYICSDEPDLQDREHPGEQPKRPQAKRTKHGWRLFPPKKPRIWSVGDTIGETIRQGRQQQDEPGERNSPRPHLRRAHWHGFWHGPKEGERRFRYKWLPPMVVAGEKS